MNTPGIASSPILWIASLGVFVVIVVQSFAYLRAARRAAPAVGMSRTELVGAFRTGAFSALGPSLAVVFIAISLLPVFGTPAVLLRIGLIGSAAFEVVSAQTAAGTLGVELGGSGYDNGVFALVFFTMSLGGAAWMLSTLLCTPMLRRADRRVRRMNPVVMTIVPSAAMIAAFCYLGLEKVQTSHIHLITYATGAAVMAGLRVAAARLTVQWIKEWSVGIAMAAALVAAGIAL
ncbi:DUF5058 family protein [Haloactinomyces albus]|uniref:DUF5058 domain-containing protein n=1 Tax=Haloactinomyces albus TaxID=1352928 RepID=A0AAE3Z7N8_9ACTN|nr:DUF5058 family protein [Haloactinomyces albus]MDR7299841.1 hypothetical protein [Haloactinomyces albus]